MHDSARTANLLGATALAVTDLAIAETTGAAGLSTSGAAALVTLFTTPGLSVTELGHRVGLSQPAAARMVDSLEQRELVIRRRPMVGRVVNVEPTAKGRRTARGLLAARRTPLAEVVAALDAAEQEQLAELLGKLLTRLYDEVGDNELMCRLCDRKACTTDATCPVGEADRVRQEQDV